MPELIIDLFAGGTICVSHQCPDSLACPRHQCQHTFAEIKASCGNGLSGNFFGRCEVSQQTQPAPWAGLPLLAMGGV